MFTRFDLQKNKDLLPKKGKVLVAPLNWGIGHATRCIPIIRQLLQAEYQPVIASDGEALALLKKLFPDLTHIELPSYNVQYTTKGFLLKIKLLLQIPKFLKTFFKERKIIAKIVEEERVDALISDNRFGVFSPEIPSIYITHQLRVQSGVTSFFTTKIHQFIRARFNVCWVPDSKGMPNLSGLLSHGITQKKSPVFIGLLSSFTKKSLPITYDILLLLSGPEPQRSLLEDKLTDALKNSKKRICLVKGIIEDTPKKERVGNLTSYNFLLGKDLENIINQSELIISRSGYSTLMDLAVLEKKAFFIPTPGQTEQECLAVHLEKQRIAPYCSQNQFNEDLLDQVKSYTGF